MKVEFLTTTEYIYLRMLAKKDKQFELADKLAALLKRDFGIDIIEREMLDRRKLDFKNIKTDV